MPGAQDASASSLRLEQLLVDLLLLRDAQAVRHLDHADAIEERLVGAVGAEALPLAFVRVRDDDALVRHRADVLGADVRAILRRRQQRMQHLQRRLEHLDELEQTLRRAVEAARVGVGIGVVLAVVLELADVDLADQGRDILVVLVAGLGLGDADLAQLRGIELDDGELGDVAAELVEPLHRPWRDEAAEHARRECRTSPRDAAPMVSGLKRPSGLSKIGLVSCAGPAARRSGTAPSDP